MATRDLTLDGTGDTGDNAGCRFVTWTGLLNGDVGSPAELAAYSDQSVQLVGTLGTGGKCVIQGSNDGTNWATLNDPQGNILELTALKIEAIAELVRYVRPNITAGDGTTNLSVIMLAKRANR